ncbi:MAG: hypothetical protein HQK51_15070 [Oligoflexia bacterium]|nr:hypothetical protein [Oligoflexia bacterium]
MKKLSIVNVVNGFLLLSLLSFTLALINFIIKDSSASDNMIEPKIISKLVSETEIETKAKTPSTSPSTSTSASTTQSEISSTSNYCVKDVEDQFSKLDASNSTEIAVKAKGESCFDLSYTRSIFNKFGYQNHFQGIVRLKDNHLVISGGDQGPDKAKLFIFQLNDQPENLQSLKSNVTHTTGCLGADNVCFNHKDKLVKSIDITVKANWHAGGISNSGDILVVPIEEFRNDKKHNISSAILFYDMSNPLKPRKIEKASILTGREGRDAGSSFIHKLPDGRFIIGVRASHTIEDKECIDMYISKTQNIDDGFNDMISDCNIDEIGKIGFGQGMTIVEECAKENEKENEKEKGKNTKKQLYLITSEKIGGDDFNFGRIIKHLSISKGILMGYDTLHLHKINLDLQGSDTGSDTDKERLAITVSEIEGADKNKKYVTKRLGYVDGSTFGNMAAASTITVGSDNKMRPLTAAHHRLKLDSTRAIKIKQYGK